ncbi:MAG TPA: FAD:protein FMN transferase [Bacillota bacterium]|nr:FAD:protein FMN transferase [Bacillota bacterium]
MVAMTPAAPVFRTTRAFMDTPVTVAIAGDQEAACATAAEQAFGWFAEVEARCSRFDPNSELRALALQPGQAVPVSPVLMQALRFACAVAEVSGGAFDPTIGGRQQARGLVRNYRTGRQEPWLASGDAGAGEPTWRDIRLDEDAQTVTLLRPLLPDLGAVAKGLAVDLAARAIRQAGFHQFTVEAGGDLFAAGRAWRVGIQHPRNPGALLGAIEVRDAAVCTSGDYARRAPGGGHHILDPRAGGSPDAAVSCTVIAPSAMMADALATAAFVLGPRVGLPWLLGQGAEGMLLGPDLTPYTTPGFGRLIS